MLHREGRLSRRIERTVPGLDRLTQTFYPFRHRSAFYPEVGHAQGIEQAQSVPLEPVALALPTEIRTLTDPRSKLLLWPIHFLNYTKTTKYEALEKSAVSQLKMQQLGNLQHSRYSRNASLCWEIFNPFIDVEI